MDGYLVNSRIDQYYLTGFDGEDGATLVLPNRVYLVTDGRFEEEAARTAPWAHAIVRSTNLSEAIARLVRRHRISKLAFHPDHLSVGAFSDLRKMLKSTRMVPIPGLTDELRLIKDDTEIEAIREAIRVAEKAFKTIIRRIRIGMTEREIAADLQHEMIRGGAEEASFPIIVAEGPNAALPHARPGNRKIRVGSAVLIDWGATVGHYRSDLTRVIFVRRIPPRFRRMYENVLTAQAEALRVIAPGVRMCKVDAAARNALNKAGLGSRFVHSLGHGIGLDIHEAPRLARQATARLEPGMVVTVEPGVYVPGVGGVRIEDDVLVTTDGYQVMTTLSRNLDAMIVPGSRRSA